VNGRGIQQRGDAEESEIRMIDGTGKSSITADTESVDVARCSHSGCGVMVSKNRNLVIVSFGRGERVITMSPEDASDLRDVLPRAIDASCQPT
jgi:hypothetical protein